MVIYVINGKLFPDKATSKRYLKSEKSFKSYDQISIYM